MSQLNQKNFDLVEKKINLGRVPGPRKKKPSLKTQRQLLYSIWYMIHDRCYNPKNVAFSRYAGKGVSVCQRWTDSFDDFVSDMGERPSMFHSVERRDNSGNYCPENCYWGTPPEQTRNKDCNKWVTYKGQTMILTDLANAYNLNYGTLYSRIIKRGWSVERAVEEASKHKWLIYYEGELFSQRGLCRHLNISFARVSWHIGKGKSVKEAFEECLARKQPMEQQ
jgi:hypothetical protein